MGADIVINGNQAVVRGVSQRRARDGVGSARLGESRDRRVGGRGRDGAAPYLPSRSWL